ncbi:alpha/beta fold hydrolase [Nocardia blacklockiae]|uniref:alpha/beta fold hydrolase n=1 Tax=Nocardia blacklockiae TaxID=480036 RepID=UPI001894646A|nr:alpha/beta hydrolase [Nocardia blacklockiae]MBF6171965.1 alpha/beta fold hydrolase [Nocardia blacklockiae]
MSTFAAPELEAAYFEAYDAVLAHWPVPAETVDLAGRYGTTRVTSAGPAAAQSLVLLHGYGGTSGMWYPVVGALAEEHRVRAVDIMGEPGRSRHTGAALTSMDDLVDWLAETFDLLGLAAADLCGQSLGGHLALRFTLAHPERVRRLVLLDPPLVFAGLSPEFEELGRNRDPHPTFEAARAMLAPDGPGSGPAHLEAYFDLLAHGAAHFPASPIVYPHLPDGLTQLPVPTFVALAGASEVHDSAVAAEAARRAGAHTVVLPGAGHGLLADTEPVRSLILDHLRPHE